MIPSSHYLAIRPIHAFRRPLQRIIGIGAIGAAAAVAVAGCSGSTASTATTPASSARTAIRLAASTSQKVSTLTASLAEHLAGTTAGAMTGIMQIRLRPVPVIEATFNVVTKTMPAIKLAEILTGNAIYFKNPAFAKAAGKPWVKVKISQLTAKSGLSLASMLANLEGSNPLDQTRLFTASRNVRVVGSQLVGGVATTEYSGSYAPSAALAQLPPRLRGLLGPVLRSMGKNQVRFHIWIDAQHMIRKADDTETVTEQRYTTSFVVTSINQPIKVTLPPAAKTAPLPKI